MPSYKVAWVKEQGVNLVIVPVESSFGEKDATAQQEFVNEVLVYAAAGGLPGTVVPVWDCGGGRLACFAPPNLHAFFNKLTMKTVYVNINRAIEW